MAGAKEGKTAKYKLRSYQEECVQRFLDDLETSDSCASVLPTGSGKSLIMIDMIDKLRPKLGIDGSILILCHLSDPLHQLFESYEKLGERPARLKFWLRSIIPSIQYDVIFSTMQKMSKQKSIDDWRSHCQKKMVRVPKYIFIDEAHSYGAPSYRKIRDIFPEAKLIGLSASPFRSNKYSFACFEKISYTISMGELIQLGFLTAPKTEKVHIPDSMNTDAGRIALSFQIWKERESRRGLVSIIYFPTTEIAKSALASFTQNLGARCGYIDGSTKMREAKKMLVDAREGKYDILINCQRLETGVDIPNIGAVIMPYACGSVVRYMQRVGRALRLFPGKDHAMIYLCGDTPSIEKGNWEEMHNKAILARDPLPSECLLEELKDDDGKDKLRLEWTKSAIEACKILESDGMVTLSRFLAEKKFPSKYDKFITRMMRNAKPSEGYDDSPASEIQVDLITKKYGLPESRVRTMTKVEASAFINGFRCHLDSSPYIFRDGKHMGQHPAELHPYARKWIFRGDKHNSTYRTLSLWFKAGKPGVDK